MIEQKNYYLKRLSSIMIAFFILISCDLEHDEMNVSEIESTEVTSMQLRSSSGTGVSDVNSLVQDYIENLRDVLYGVESFITDKNGYTNSNAENNAIDSTFGHFDIEDAVTGVKISVFDMDVDELNSFIDHYLSKEYGEMNNLLTEYPELISNIVTGNYIMIRLN